MRCRPLWLVVAVVALWVVAVPAASARPHQDQDQDDVRIDLAVGVEGHVSSSRSFPIAVDITTPRLLAGTLVVTIETDFGLSTIEQAVEVAASTTKRYLLTAPPAAAFGGQVSARLRTGDDTVADAEERLSTDAGSELVGVLPSLQAGLARTTVPLAMGVGVARIGPVTAEALAEGPLALEVFDQIASGPGDLEDLSQEGRSAVSTWVAQGGHLLVDAEPGASVGLPEALDPSPATTRTVGLGRVVLTGGSLAAGRWEDALRPTPTRSMHEEGPLGGFHLGGDVTSALASDAGFRLPSILTLLLVLGAYTVVVGPVAWLVARRMGRPTLLWVAVPVVTALVTVSLQVVGDDFKGSDEAVHLTMVESGPARGRGGTTVDLPPGWQVAVNPFLGGFDGRMTPMHRVGDGTVVPVDPGSGGASVVRTRGPVADGGGLVVAATSDADGVVRGTVENRGDVDLHDVAVMVGRVAVVDVGDLPAGRTEAWELDDAADFAFDATPEATVWPPDMDPRMFGGVMFGPNGEELRVAPQSADGAASFSGYADLASVHGTNFKPPGEAVAVGWTREVDAPVRVGGAAVSDGRTGFVARSPVTPAGDRLSDVAATRLLLRGPDGAGGAGFGGGGFGPAVPLPQPVPLPAGPVPTTVVLEPGIDLSNAGAALFGFMVPPDVGGRPVDADRLRLSVPAQYVGAQVWDGAGWVALPANPGRGPQEVDVPDGALVQDAVYVRVLVPFDRPLDRGREFVLYEAAT